MLSSDSVLCKARREVGVGGNGDCGEDSAWNWKTEDRLGSECWAGEQDQGGLGEAVGCCPDEPHPILYPRERQVLPMFSMELRPKIYQYYMVLNSELNDFLLVFEMGGGLTM